MVRRFHNLCLYPNVYLMDTLSSQIRQYRPIAVDKMEVTTYCRRLLAAVAIENGRGAMTGDDLPNLPFDGRAVPSLFNPGIA
jgi:hypothetical protein